MWVTLQLPRPMTYELFFPVHGEAEELSKRLW